MISETAKVRQINNYGGYLRNLEVVDIALMVKDLYIPDHIKEDFLEEGLDYLKEYVNSEDYDINDYELWLVITENNVNYVTIENGRRDHPEYLGIDKDGTVVAYNELPSPDLSTGNYYSGDEFLILADQEPFGSDSQWLWSGLSKIKFSRSFCITKETMWKIIETHLEGEENETVSES